MKGFVFYVQWIIMNDNLNQRVGEKKKKNNV